MYRVKILEAFGPFCGMGGFGTMVGIGMSKSVKKAITLAKANFKGTEGGGVPIHYEFTIHKDNKLILLRY